MAESQAVAPNSLADAAQARYDVDEFATSTTHQYQAYLNEIPDEWMIRTLGEVAAVVGGGTPSRDTESFWNGDIPWVTPGEVSKEESKYLTTTAERITAAGLAGSGANLLSLGALMVTTRATLGARAIAGAPMATNQGFKSLVFSSPTDADFYFYLAPKFKPELVRRASGTTFLEISAREFAQIEVPCPPTAEKKRIAHILDTLDTAIRQTEAIIAKLKLVKRGLLHDLLTRGIDGNGELRPPQSRAPHLYKQSPLGWIPKEWEYKPFGELCESSAFGPRFPSDAYDENGPLATLRTTDMDDEGNISLSTMPRATITPSTFADHLLRPGDIVISRSGTCGVTGVFTGHDIPVVPGAFLIRFRLRDPRLNAFYRRYFNSARGRPLLARLAVGGVQKNIKGSDVLNLVVPTPPPEEAVGIAERIEMSERDIDLNLRVQAKLNREKSGLMDDLFTGRVRVTPLLEAATAP